MRNTRPAIKSQYQIELQGPYEIFDNVNLFTGYSFQGVKTETITVVDPVRMYKSSIPTMRTYGSITLTMEYYPELMKTLYSKFLDYDNTLFMIKVRPGICGTKNQFIPLSYEITHYECIWIGCQGPEANHSDNQVSNVTLEFTSGRVIETDI